MCNQNSDNMLPKQIQILGSILTLKEVHNEYVNPYAIYTDMHGEESVAWLDDRGENIVQVD